MPLLVCVCVRVCGACVVGQGEVQRAQGEAERASREAAATAGVLGEERAEAGALRTRVEAVDAQLRSTLAASGAREEALQDQVRWVHVGGRAGGVLACPWLVAHDGLKSRAGAGACPAPLWCRQVAQLRRELSTNHLVISRLQDELASSKQQVQQPHAQGISHRSP